MILTAKGTEPTMFPVWRITGRAKAKSGESADMTLYAVTKGDGIMPTASRVLSKLHPGAYWESLSGTTLVGELPAAWDAGDPQCDGLTMHFGMGDES
ncbi:MAG: hypothetical protein AB7G11_11070 [Phycisphaerales bacterium]